MSCFANKNNWKIEKFKIPMNLKKKMQNNNEFDQIKTLHPFTIKNQIWFSTKKIFFANKNLECSKSKTQKEKTIYFTIEFKFQRW